MFKSKKSSLTYEEARDKALRLLGVREHSEQELSEKLSRSGAEPEDIEKVIEYCREYNYVNDSRFAEVYSRHLHTSKMYSKGKIAYELKRKGVSAEDIESALAEMEEYTEEELIPTVERKLKGDFSIKQRNKVKRYFYNKGFSISLINSCIERIIAENEV